MTFSWLVSFLIIIAAGILVFWQSSSKNGYAARRSQGDTRKVSGIVLKTLVYPWSLLQRWNLKKPLFVILIVCVLYFGYCFWWNNTQSKFEKEHTAKVSYSQEGIVIRFSKLKSGVSGRIEILEDIEIWSGTFDQKKQAILLFDGTLYVPQIRGAVGSKVSSFFAEASRYNPDDHYGQKKNKSRGYIRAYTMIDFKKGSNEIRVLPAVEGQEIFFSENKIPYRLVQEKSKKESK